MTNGAKFMRILCTGNPSKPTIARSVSKIFDNVDYACSTTGWDLRMWDAESETHFRNEIKNYDVLINASFICNGGQMKILNTTYEECDSMHVFNIGSTLEHLGVNNKYDILPIEKRSLRDRSLQLNNYRTNFKTTHITPAGLNDGQPGHENWLNMDYIAESIDWIIRRPYSITHITIQ